MALDWLNIAGGAGKGYVAGDEDNRRREEFNTLQRQRLRVEKEQKLDDELAATLKQVRPAGEYTDAVPANTVESGAGFEGPPSGIKKTKVTAADADRKRADILAGRGNLQSLQAATQLRQGAHQTEQAERAEQRAQTEDVFLKAGQLKSLGNHVGAMRHLAQAYDKVPDGHKIEIVDVGGVPHVGVAGPSGEYIEKPVPITAEVVDKMIARGIEMTSVQAQQKGRELGIHQQTADSGRISAEAATKNAEANYAKAMFEAGPDAQKQREADIQYRKDLGKAALINANANAADAGARGTAAKHSQSIPFSDGKGGTVYMTPIRDPKTGAITSWQRDNMPEGLTPFKQPQVLNDVQKEMLKLHGEKVKAGAFKTPIEEEAALKAIIGGDDFFSRMNAADPTKQPGAAAPTAPAVPAKPRRAETKEEAEARRQREKFLKPGAPPTQITPEELYSQAEAQIRAASQR